MKHFSPLITVFWIQILIVAKRPMNIATGLIFPWMFFSLMTFQRLENLDKRSVTAAFTSALLASFWSASVWSAGGVIRRDKWMGTLRSLYTGHLSPIILITIKTLAASFYDLFLILVACVGFLIVFELPFEISHPLAFLLGLLGVYLGGNAASLLLGSVVVFSKYAFYISASVGMPLLLLGGFVVPPALLPDPIQVFSYVINLRWFRDFLFSSVDVPSWHALILGILLSIVYFWVARYALSSMLKKAKEEGSLEI